MSTGNVTKIDRIDGVWYEWDGQDYHLTWPQLREAARQNAGYKKLVAFCEKSLGGPLPVQTIMPFGKHRGQPLDQIPASYLVWVLDHIENLNKKLRKEIENTVVPKYRPKKCWECGGEYWGHECPCEE